MTRLSTLLLLLGLAVSSAHGASIETLVMPGDLIEGHAKTEEKCEACHAKFSRVDQNKLCADCHKEVGADVAKGEGFHGRLRNATTVQCRTCHTDHKGRKVNVVLLDRDNFDHSKTDFALKGGHTKVACADCHKQGKKWREAPTDCFSCHEKDDAHESKLGKKCADCHGSETWRKARFDHAKTKFKLEGAHEKVLCAACHPGNAYKDTPKECVSCHRIHDVHAGRYGKKCETCHSAAEWKKPRFDHEKTKFPLRDKHEKVACEGCHKGEDIYKDYKDKKFTCNECHKNDDVHRGKNGPKCESCHDVKGWGKSKFDHDKTKFALRNKHKDVSCETCHKGDVYKVKLETNCFSCHKGDDRHKGDLGEKCESCHNDKNWSDKVRFDHDLTTFPLIGLHATAPCEACHVSKAYKKTPKECVKCHESDDEHKARLGTACAACHTPNDWKVWKFDHDKTDFKLKQKHAGLDCLACHKQPMSKEVEQSSACAACHRNDDVHLGRFGANCERCHNAKTFKEVQIKR